ncbi:MAG: lipocalin family protein [Ferruginibacter sp.]
MKKMILSLVVLSAVLISCKKDDKNCDLNAANFAGTYKITAWTYKANTATAPVDVMATFPACERDDLVIFNANNTVNYTDAGTLCSPPGNSTGTWLLTGNSINIDGDVYVVAAFSCSGTTLTLAGSAAGELNTITFTRQ